MVSPNKFILDTNVLISAFILRASIAYKVLAHCISNGVLLFSTETFEEFGRVISRRQFDKYLKDDDRKHLMSELFDISEHQKISSDLRLCTDDTDNMFLNLAVDGAASCIITGDMALLKVNPLGHMPILNPRQFLYYFSEFGGPILLSEAQQAYGED